MNEMANYRYADLTKEQEEILKRAEDEINAKANSHILVMAFKGRRE